MSSLPPAIVSLQSPLLVALGHVHLRKEQRQRHPDDSAGLLESAPAHFIRWCRLTAGPNHSGLPQNLRVEPVQGLPHRLPAESFTGAFP